MPVRKGTIEEHAEKQVVVMAGYHRLADVIEVFIERDYAENEAYLVVCEADGRIGVMSFLELGDLWEKEKPKLADVSLAEWDIPEVSRVWTSEEVKSGLEVVEWVKGNPDSRAVVVDQEGQFVCLFANPNLSDTRALDFFLPLPRLHGELNKLYLDSRRFPSSLGGHPLGQLTCPHCQHQDVYVMMGQPLICNNQDCGKELDKS